MPRHFSCRFHLGLGLVIALWVVASGLLSPVVLAQEGPNRAALVVRFSDGNVQTACVSFDAPAISGAELLTRSGIQAIMDYNSGLGGAVCSMNGYGCAYPTQDCFCQCQGAQCEYWASYHWTDSGWQYSQVGASSYQVTNGAIEGWSWGPGNFSSGTEPPQVSFADICPASVLPAEDNHPKADSLLVPVVHAQELPAVNTGGTQAANSAPASGAQFSDYMTYLLFAAALGGICIGVLMRRKGQQPLP